MASKPTGRPVGRPTKYSSEVAERVLSALADGMSLTQVESLPGLVYRSTIRNWRRRVPEFARRYAHARLQGIESQAARIMQATEVESSVTARAQAEAEAAAALIPESHPQKRRKARNKAFHAAMLPYRNRVDQAQLSLSRQMQCLKGL